MIDKTDPVSRDEWRHDGTGARFDEEAKPRQIDVLDDEHRNLLREYVEDAITNDPSFMSTVEYVIVQKKIASGLGKTVSDELKRHVGAWLVDRITDGKLATLAHMQDRGLS